MSDIEAQVVLLRDKNDSVYQKYLAILLACKEIDLDPPKEVDDYFGGDGVDCDPDFPLEIKFEPREWNDGIYAGYEIDIDELPPGVKTIRYYVSW